jgi:hypothetical protein
MNNMAEDVEKRTAIIPCMEGGKVVMKTPTEAEALQRQGKLHLAEDTKLLRACLAAGLTAFGQRWDQSIDDKKPLAREHMSFARLKKSSILDAIHLLEQPAPPSGEELKHLIGPVTVVRPFSAGRKQHWRGWRVYLSAEDVWRTLANGQTSLPSELVELQALRDRTAFQAGQVRGDAQQFFTNILFRLDKAIAMEKAKLAGLR